ncbi:acid-sensing ion channel 1C-like [Physella acuta]|uniref:acid-sensing ion channel 1C-like n=1 Tax=Physella acuta TaxID=109671 RepID=UPI0027DE5A25|nr:acid-sensing ion channel 1C-like [Physella acuta]
MTVSISSHYIGLELTVYLETDKYLPGITSGEGAQVVIHEQGTVPFPDEEGIAAASAAQTLIGLKQLCQKICQANKVRAVCNCYDTSNLEVNDVMKIPDTLKPCTNQSELQCVTRLSSNVSNDDTICDCSSPCRYDFLKLNIYFEDLNYERISEQPDYEIIQMFSDVGGTIGLWIGLSLLSLFELLHLIVDVVVLVATHMCRKI